MAITIDPNDNAHQSILQLINSGKTKTTAFEALVDSLELDNNDIQTFKDYAFTTSGDLATTVPGSSPSNSTAGGAYQNKIAGAKVNEESFFIFSLISGDMFILNGAVEDVGFGWQSEWNEERVYGRTDPIPTYSNTSRTLNFSLTLVSSIGALDSTTPREKVARENYIYLNGID